jgi:hypothetical protein
MAELEERARTYAAIRAGRSSTDPDASSQGRVFENDGRAFMSSASSIRISP